MIYSTTMAVQKKSIKGEMPDTGTTMGKISYEKVILAHKFTCPYYSIRQAIKINNTDTGRMPTLKTGHCGAESVWKQNSKAEAQCTGNCWYMNHFKRLLKELEDEPSIYCK